MIRPQLEYDPWAVLEESVKNTPDWVDLKKSPFEEFLIFVTGNLRNKRSKNTQYLEGCNYYGQASTWDRNFFLKRAGTYSDNYIPEPLAIQFGDHDLALRERFKEKFNYEHMGRIEGDVYGVPLRTLARIDKYENNGEEVHRELKWVDFHHSCQARKSIRVFMYIADMDVLEDFCECGVPLITCNTIFNSNGRAYYFAS